jgi:hypothetical protein
MRSVKKFFIFRRDEGIVLALNNNEQWIEKYYKTDHDNPFYRVMSYVVGKDNKIIFTEKEIDYYEEAGIINFGPDNTILIEDKDYSSVGFFSYVQENDMYVRTRKKIVYSMFSPYEYFENCQFFLWKILKPGILVFVRLQPKIDDSMIRIRSTIKGSSDFVLYDYFSGEHSLMYGSGIHYGGGNAFSPSKMMSLLPERVCLLSDKGSNQGSSLLHTPTKYTLAITDLRPLHEKSLNFFFLRNVFKQGRIFITIRNDALRCNTC